MKINRSGIDRRSVINESQKIVTTSLKQKTKEQRITEEPIDMWVKFSEWSSVNLDIRNRYFWALFK